MSGRRSRDKRAGGEREVVQILRDFGIASERIPLSGAMGTYKGNVICPVLGDDRLLEVKWRAPGVAQIYGWKAGNYGLVIRADNRPPPDVARPGVAL